MLYYTHKARKSAIESIKNCISKIAQVSGAELSYQDATQTTRFLSILINEIEKEDRKDSNIEINPFIDDGEKMRDFFTLTKEEFLDSYSYLTEKEYNATIEYVKRHNIETPLWVCDHCLHAIETREGKQIYRKWDVDPDDENRSKCDWCEETGFCTLNEIL